MPAVRTVKLRLKLQGYVDNAGNGSDPGAHAWIHFIHSFRKPTSIPSLGAFWSPSAKLCGNWLRGSYAAIGNWSRRLCPHLVIGYAGYAVFGYTDYAVCGYAGYAVIGYAGYATICHTDYAVICYWLCWLYDNWLRR